MSVIINSNTVIRGYTIFGNFPTPTPTPTMTQTPTNTPTMTQTPTNTPTITQTPTNTPTPSFTPTMTQTPTNTPTPSFTPTMTQTPTNTPTPSFTPTLTPTPTSTRPVYAGDIDTSFVIGTGFNASVSSIIVQPDNKIIALGAFTSYSGVSYNRIVRLNNDGSIDSTFNFGVGFNAGFTNQRNSVLQNDGKILIGGAFTTYSGISYNRIIRLNVDGSIDNTFNIGTGFSSNVNSVILQSNNKILVGGVFQSYSGAAYNRLIRLNTDGSIDNTFNIGTGFNNTVSTVTVQSDNKILVSGQFTSYSGISAGGIIRLNSDGSIDNTFNSGVGLSVNTQANVITVQPDGKLLVGGTFTSYSGITSTRLMRLNNDGTKDTTFPNVFFGTAILDIKLQPDNKIILVGLFSSYSGISSAGIARLNTDGTFDNTFKSIPGFNPGNTSSLAIQTDSNILVGGAFTSYNGIPYTRMIRLKGTGN